MKNSVVNIKQSRPSSEGLAASLDGYVVIGVDPGMFKTGFAVVDSVKGPLTLRRTTTVEAVDVLSELSRLHPGSKVVIGDGTTSNELARRMKGAGYSLHLINEKNSTLEARKRYFELNPPRGLFKLVPSGLRFPPRPIDEYAALVLAERYIRLREQNPSIF